MTMSLFPVWVPGPVSQDGTAGTCLGYLFCHFQFEHKEYGRVYWRASHLESTLWSLGVWDLDGQRDLGKDCDC